MNQSRAGLSFFASRSGAKAQYASPYKSSCSTLTLATSPPPRSPSSPPSAATHPHPTSLSPIADLAPPVPPSPLPPPLPHSLPTLPPRAELVRRRPWHSTATAVLPELGSFCSGDDAAVWFRVRRWLAAPTLAPSAKLRPLPVAARCQVHRIHLLRQRQDLRPLARSGRLGFAPVEHAVKHGELPAAP